MITETNENEVIEIKNEENKNEVNEKQETKALVVKKSFIEDLPKDAFEVIASFLMADQRLPLMFTK